MKRYCSTGAIIALLLAGCGHSPMAVQNGGGATFDVSRSALPTPAASTAGYNMAAPISPDPAKTPGATLPVGNGDICVSGYTGKVRNVPSTVKKQVYAEYGIISRKRGEYEVDHLISLELGGSNSIKNLWPQSYQTQPWNAHVKDQLENKLHDMICAGQIDMPTAQHAIATDWIGAYKKYFKTQVPLSSVPGAGKGKHRKGSRAADAADREGEADMTGSAPVSPATAASPASAAAPAHADDVWVNLNSGKYFLPGSSHYGTTKRGAYMSEAAAKLKGYVAAKG